MSDHAKIEPRHTEAAEAAFAEAKELRSNILELAIGLTANPGPRESEDRWAYIERQSFANRIAERLLQHFRNFDARVKEESFAQALADAELAGQVTPSVIECDVPVTIGPGAKERTER